MGTLFIILTGHLVTIPTALAISEIATNQRVEGGGEYFIISRSFGLNIGATIGLALYLSQAISVAFYVIAFTEAFNPLFNFIADVWRPIPKQIISVPAMILLAYLMLKKGSSLGVKMLYIVVVVLFVSLICFFLGDIQYAEENTVNIFNIQTENLKNSFFIVFAIIFPAFTGMTAGVGLSGDLKNPGKSIPLGTTLATIAGMIIYVFIAYKLNMSASPDDLRSNSIIMKDIALFGPLIIPIGLAASTISSALGSIMVAPRTLQALGVDKSIPFKRLNGIVAKGKGENNEPYAATVLTSIIAMFFVLQGEVDFVAGIISMFFMVTYGAICLISFLYHFGADPSYRPVFKSKWYLSLIGFVLCVWLMFKMESMMAIIAIIVMVLLYLIIAAKHKDRGGMQSIFQGAIFQLSRKLHVYIQKVKADKDNVKWRPSLVCVSKASFERDKAFKLTGWIASKYGFGTYMHLIEDYFSKASNQKAHAQLENLMHINTEDSGVYIETLISPSYTSAIAQVVQLPGISGMPNNMILFEFDKEDNTTLQPIAENLALAKAAAMDICILASSKRKVAFSQGIHVWIKSTDFENSNLMILLSYIVLGHPDWKKGKIKIFEISDKELVESNRQRLLQTIQSGRLPISPNNIEIIEKKEGVGYKEQIAAKSKDAGLVVVGFWADQIKNDQSPLTGFEDVGDVLFVHAHDQKVIE